MPKSKTVRRPTMSPQNQTILWLLQTKGSITPLNALVNFGITRLAARIEELRRMKFKIETVMKKVNRKRYASYRLITA